MASWDCLQASQCGSGNCRMDGMREWEDRDAHLKTDYQRKGHTMIESKEKDKKNILHFDQLKTDPRLMGM